LLEGKTTEQTITSDLEGIKSDGYWGAILDDADGSGLEKTAEKKMTTCFRNVKPTDHRQQSKLNESPRGRETE
jgi:hypothetical protein